MTIGPYSGFWSRMVCWEARPAPKIYHFLLLGWAWFFHIRLFFCLTNGIVRSSSVLSGLRACCYENLGDGLCWLYGVEWLHGAQVNKKNPFIKNQVFYDKNISSNIYMFFECRFSQRFWCEIGFEWNTNYDINNMI